MRLVELSAEELHLTFVSFLADEVGQDDLARLYGEKDIVTDAVNRAFEPPPAEFVTNADGYAFFMLPLVVTGRLDPHRAPEALRKVEAEFERYATPWLKAYASQLATRAAAILSAAAS